MSDERREKEIEMHIYGARLLLDCLWEHLATEFDTVDKIEEFIGVMLRDISDFYREQENHICEECQKEESNTEPASPGVVLPFPGNRDKDWGNN